MNLSKSNLKKAFSHPWGYIPTLYFAEGLPYILINSVSVILYKRLGISNAQITFWTSLLYLPWVIKMAWGPFVDLYSTKRQWVITTQIAMAVCLSCVALALPLPQFFSISLIIFTIGAFISATHDIAADGFYLLALNPEQQALYAGIRSVFYRLAVIFGTGFLVFLAGKLEDVFPQVALGWSVAIGIAAVLFILIALYHAMVLPFPESKTSNPLNRKTDHTTDPEIDNTPDNITAQPTANPSPISTELPATDTESTNLVKSAKPSASSNSIPFWKIISTYFQQPKIIQVLLFILLYRFGEAMLVKLATPFLLDDPSQGGLGLTTADVGLVYGTFGTLSLIIGGILGGAIVSKYGLKKTLFPLALALNLPDLFYVYMAFKQPTIELVYPLVSLEQFGYGLGFTSFMVYLMQISQGEYKTSHYAISTGIMALGMMIPGMVSGRLQELVSYPTFFIIVCWLTIPGMITLFFLPLPDPHTSKPSA